MARLKPVCSGYWVSDNRCGPGYSWEMAAKEMNRAKRKIVRQTRSMAFGTVSFGYREMNDDD